MAGLITTIVLVGLVVLVVAWFGLRILPIIAAIILGIAGIIWIGSKITKATAKEEKTLEETAKEMLEKGEILSRKHEIVYFKNRESLEYMSYVVEYDGMRYLIQIDAFGKIITFQNINYTILEP